LGAAAQGEREQHGVTSAVAGVHLDAEGGSGMYIGGGVIAVILIILLLIWLL
jgi:hypothetical protein